MPTDLTPDLIKRILRLWEADPDTLEVRDGSWRLVRLPDCWAWGSPEYGAITLPRDNISAAALIRCRLEDAADERCEFVRRYPDGRFDWALGKGLDWVSGYAPTRLDALVALHEARLGIGEEMNNADSL